MPAPWEVNDPQENNQEANPDKVLDSLFDQKPQEAVPEEPAEETPPDPVFDFNDPNTQTWLQLLGTHAQMAQQLADLKDREMEIRRQLAKFFFPNKKQGTFYQDLPDDWQVKGEFSLNYKVDEASLPAVMEQLPEGTEDKVIRTKKELCITEYKKLIAPHKKILSEALVVKPGSPNISLIPPKKG